LEFAEFVLENYPVAERFPELKSRHGEG